MNTIEERIKENIDTGIEKEDEEKKERPENAFSPPAREIPGSVDGASEDEDDKETKTSDDAPVNEGMRGAEVPAPFDFVATTDGPAAADAVSPFQMTDFGDEGTVTTFEQAVRKIVILEDRLKRKDAELADVQKQIESVLSENLDAVEAREKAEEALRVMEAELAGAVEKLRVYESEAAKADRTIKHEHEKRRLHLLHVRDLKHAIAERDARIRQLESGARHPGGEPLESSTVAQEIKKLQSDIFYKEIEIENINSQLLAAQNEILALKTRNDELNTEISSLKLELEYRENTIAELNGTVIALEAELKGVTAKYSALAQLDIGPEDIEKLRLASEMKEFLEAELDGIQPAGEEAGGSGVKESQDGAASDNLEREGAFDEGKKQLSELDEIKEKFKSLIAERDKAIELLDKFEVEAKLKERELNELKTKFAAVCADKDAAEAGLKEKEIELQGLYGAFSSYKEESGFMSRENKMLKEEREALVAEVSKIKQSLKELEAAVAEKDAQLERVTAESEAKIRAALEECEAKIGAADAEKEDAIRKMKAECEAEVESRGAEAEKRRLELERLRDEFNAIEAKYRSALSDYHGLKLNVEGLLAGISETLERELGGLGPDGAEVGGVVENSLRVISCLPEDKTAETAARFENFAANCELALTLADYSAFEDAVEKTRPAICVLLIGGENDLLKAVEIKPSVLAPMILYSANPLPVSRITELVSRGVIEDYIDAAYSSVEIERIMARAIEERLARLQKVNIKKDCDEIKLRESVALTIDNKVKAGRIEALNERISYLKDANRRMKAGIDEMQGLFDQIISRITALSLQDIPPNITEGFNEITSILLRITSIKL